MSVQENKKARWRLHLYFLCFSIVVALFAFGSSPFYPIEDWADPNCFFTVGKTMLNGKVLYRDIYEQKGFYVYFLHALCALISDSSFIGVFFFEIALLFFVLFFAWKILELYQVDGTGVKLTVVSLLGISVAFSFAMSTGNSVEEFVSPFFLGTIYQTLKHIKGNDDFKKREYLLIGIFSGIVFWAKFTLVAFFVGWFAFFVCRNIRRKTLMEIPKCIGFVVLGVALATLPGLVYFLAHGAVKNWLTAYLYDNLFIYSGDRNFWQTIWYPFQNIGVTLLSNFFYGAFVVLGVVWFSWKKRGEERLLLAIVPVVTALLIFIGGRGYRYYGLPLYVFAIFGYIALLEIGVEHFFRTRVWAPIVLSLVVVACCVGNAFVNGTVHYLFRQKEDTVQYTFAKYVKEHGGEDATLLNYGFLDRGFYLALDQTPQFKYFCTLNVPLEDMYAEMDYYLEEKIPDYVVTAKSGNDLDIYMESENYEEVLSQECWYRGRKVVYTLYQRI